MYMAMGSVPAMVQHLQPELATGLPSLQAVLGRVRRDLASPDCLVKNALKAAHNSRTPQRAPAGGCFCIPLSCAGLHD